MQNVTIITVILIVFSIFLQTHFYVSSQKNAPETGARFLMHFYV